MRTLGHWLDVYKKAGELLDRRVTTDGEQAFWMARNIIDARENKKLGIEVLDLGPIGAQGKGVSHG